MSSFANENSNIRQFSESYAREERENSNIRQFSESYARKERENSNIRQFSESYAREERMIFRATSIIIHPVSCYLISIAKCN